MMNTISLNESQTRVFNDAINWWRLGTEQTFEISGPPGSGKTFLINHIIKALNINMDRIAPMSYTGSATINMRTKGMYNAGTIFSWLYVFKEIPVRNEKGEQIFDPVFNKPKFKMMFTPKTHLENIDLIIIDEAGMVPKEMRTVIESMNIPVIAVGDLDQLPPVAGKAGYLTDESRVHKLTEIMRQANDNTIIKFSQMLIKGNRLPHGKFKNVTVIYDDELNDDMISKSDIIICGKNSTRDQINNHVRHDMFGFTNSIPNLGERLVCRKNNWQIESGGINLTNGLVGNCVSMISPASFNHENNTFKMSFKPDIVDTCFSNIDVDFRYMIADKKGRDALLETHFSEGNKFEFGYAITTHMSQGSEFNNGIYFEEYLNKNINNNLNYVGITRFKNHCIYVVKKPKKYW